MVKRFGVLLCAPGSDYVKKRYAGYFNLFFNMLSEPGEVWEVFRVVDGEFPAIEELYKFDGFVVSGSRHDAHGNDAWILDLCYLLQTLDAMFIKILGICFGHQVLCRALGGKNGRSPAGWDLGLRRIRVFDGLTTRFSGLKIPSSLSVVECHQDQVFKVPLDAEILASSDKTVTEMFSLGEHILGIQGHPEYTTDILVDIIDNLLDKNLIEDETAEEGKASVLTTKPDRDIWEQICKSFLKTCRDETWGCFVLTDIHT
eukprot:Gb_25784 [translate_table: standard]